MLISRDNTFNLVLGKNSISLLMKNILRLTVLLILSIPSIVFAQPCSCGELLQELVTKVQTNYAGYIHKIKEAKDSSAYLVLKNKLNKEAATTSFKDCYTVLNKYVSYFNDGHLFVIELPRNTPQQSDSLRQFIKTVSLTDEELDKIRNKKTTDPIEGIWGDADQQLAVIKTGANKFIAVTIENKNTKWTRGMVKMEIERVKTGDYHITIYRNDFASVRFTKVRIYKGCVLPFGVYRFARTYPVHTELKYIHTKDPAIPFYQQLDAKNILLTVPTALIGKNILDSVLLRHQKEIMSTENLIIDIRGNLGGNSIWKNLLAGANTKEYGDRKVPGEDDFLMLASPDNAEYFDFISSYLKQIRDSAGITYYENLKRKILQSTGTIIGFSFYDPNPDTARRMVYDFPRRVAIITDRGTASAGEAFVLSMKENSNKVVVYGDNTYGMIDYMNINTKKLLCKDNNTYYYGYPTFFSHTTKAAPVNPTGIKPDVYVPAKTGDWIKWVQNDLSKKK